MPQHRKKYCKENCTSINAVLNVYDKSYRSSQKEGYKMIRFTRCYQKPSNTPAQNSRRQNPCNLYQSSILHQISSKYQIHIIWYRNKHKRTKKQVPLSGDTSNYLWKRSSWQKKDIWFRISCCWEKVEWGQDFGNILYIFKHAKIHRKEHFMLCYANYQKTY